MCLKRIDPFFYQQPPLQFIHELKQPVHQSKPTWFRRTVATEGEVDASGAYLINGFPDPEGLLETALEDFSCFLQIYRIAGNRYPLRITQGETDIFESYRIEICESGCRIIAADTEGIRRALFFLEDEMHRRSGPLLPAETIRRRPVLRHRITRGFFSPTNRPPKNIDELLDDVDYYPDQYLNRLAHDGTNGLWIYTYFNQLIRSDIFTEYGKDSHKRIRKLKQIVAKCKRYGIKVWVFGVEPFAMAPQIAVNYPDAIGGVNWNGHYSVCTFSEQGSRYCIEVTQRLFQQIPDLGGIIDITYGERPTSCANSDDYCQCPRCRNYSRNQILARTIDLLKEGIRRSGSNAEFVSWTYAHRLSSEEEIREYVRLAPEDVILQENFEDAGYVSQLGKERQAIDYWLSYTGPSQMFCTAAEAASATGKRMFAKMQVCCSHELATVPYIPVPGILFDKYAAARKYGVEGVMQCWYFGNYPSLMSKAAGELAFVDEACDKRRFLRSLAGIYCGTQASELANAWSQFEEGYRNYPVNIMFSYYGPMHDGVVWELQLEPKDLSLPRSWQLMDKPNGDRIGECLQNGHTLPEAVLLAEHMHSDWTLGLSLLPENTPAEQRSVARALALLFSSGKNILRFYLLRTQLAAALTFPAQLLEQMEQILEEEIQCSEEMISLCLRDPRLGYHSEAEGYKFFPKKLKHRICQLKQLQATEFPAVRLRIARGELPLPWYSGAAGPGIQIVRGLKALSSAAYHPISDQDAAFRVAFDQTHLYIQLQGTPGTRFRMHFAYDPLWPSPGIILSCGQKSLSPWAVSHQSVWGNKINETLNKYRIVSWEPAEEMYLISISRQAVGWTQDRPLRLMLAANEKSWISDSDPVYHLGKNDISPGEFGWLRP